MTAIKMRPTFRLETQIGEQELMNCIQSVFSNGSTGDSEGYSGQFTTHHAMISMVESKRHFWSPWMHLEIRDEEQTRVINGRFSPHPSIWTGFMFSYLGIGVLVFFAAMFGISQQLSGQSPWAYYFIPLGAVIVAILWFASQAGQKLARDEMQQLKSRLEACIDRQE